jgi:hypothetical protein
MKELAITSAVVRNGRGFATAPMRVPSRGTPMNLGSKECLTSCDLQGELADRRRGSAPRGGSSERNAWPAV